MADDDVTRVDAHLAQDRELRDPERPPSSVRHDRQTRRDLGPPGDPQSARSSDAEIQLWFEPTSPMIPGRIPVSS